MAFITVTTTLSIYTFIVLADLIQEARNTADAEEVSINATERVFWDFIMTDLG